MFGQEAAALQVHVVKHKHVPLTIVMPLDMCL